MNFKPNQIGTGSLQNMATFHFSTGFNLPIHSKGIFRSLVSKKQLPGREFGL